MNQISRMLTFETRSSFTAWVVGAGYPATGISASAWYVEAVGQPYAAVCSAKASEGHDSNSWRATAGALASLLESLGTAPTGLLRGVLTRRLRHFG